MAQDRWVGRFDGAAEVALPRGRAPSSTTAAPDTAGRDDSIPPSFIVLFDLLWLAGAFALTRPLAPFAQQLLLPGGGLGVPLPSWLLTSEVAQPSDFSTLPSMLWMLAIAAPTIVLFMAMLGGYRQAVDQTRLKLIASSVLSPLLAVSIITLTLFALKDLNSS